MDEPNYYKPYYQSVSSWNELPWVTKFGSIFILVLVIIGIILLLFAEYSAHDCIPGKQCNHRVPEPNQYDNNFQYVDKIQNMVINNYQYVTWRLALLTGLIATIPIIYFLKRRIPTFIEWLIVGGLIFIITYISFSWIWAHFFYPNSKEIGNHLALLRDRIHKLEADTEK